MCLSRVRHRQDFKLSAFHMDGIETTGLISTFCVDGIGTTGLTMGWKSKWKFCDGLLCFFGLVTIRKMQSVRISMIM